MDKASWLRTDQSSKPDPLSLAKMVQGECKVPRSIKEEEEIRLSQFGRDDPGISKEASGKNEQDRIRPLRVLGYDLWIRQMPGRGSAQSSNALPAYYA